MRTLLLKSVLLAAIVAILSLAASQVPLMRFRFDNGTVESNLLVIPRNSTFDVMILGTSHGRIFSRAGNHSRVERALGVRMINLAKGDGRGITAEDAYLSYFYERGNSVKVILYLIDPFVFYSDQWNDDSDFLFDEPFDARFLSFVIRRGTHFHVLLNYMKSKLSWGWVALRPDWRTVESHSLASVDTRAVELRLASLYGAGMPRATFEKYAAMVERMALLAKEKGASMVFIVPTTLLGRVPGTDELLRELDVIRERHGAAYRDLSQAITDPALFYDHDHLNSAGVELFTRSYLKPYVDGRPLMR